MTSLTDIIAQTEGEWIKPLYLHINNLFSGTNLPSHDADHHLRVWIHCKELMLELDRAGVPINDETVRQCIVACFFHDTGLLKEIGENHGAESRILCKLYLDENPQFKVVDRETLLRAIEKHDDKHERTIEATCIGEITSTHRLISTADDLDAFGNIGVCRYIEIYLKRNIGQEVLAKRIATNLRGRFNNFWQSYSLLQKFSHLQKIRYNQTLTFLVGLGEQLPSAVNNNNGPIEVFNIIADAARGQQLDFEGMLEIVKKTRTSDFVLTFFQQLKRENEILNPYRSLLV